MKSSTKIKTSENEAESDNNELNEKIHDYLEKREKLKRNLAAMQKSDKIRYFLFFLILFLILLWRYIGINNIFDRF